MEDHVRRVNKIKENLGRVIDDVSLLNTGAAEELQLIVEGLQDSINEGFSKILKVEAISKLTVRVNDARKSFLAVLYREYHKRTVGNQEGNRGR